MHCGIVLGWFPRRESSFSSDAKALDWVGCQLSSVYLRIVLASSLYFEVAFCLIIRSISLCFGREIVGTYIYPIMYAKMLLTGFHITSCPVARGNHFFLSGNQKLTPGCPIGQPKVLLYVFTIILPGNQNVLSGNLKLIVVARKGNRFSKRMWNPVLNSIDILLDHDIVNIYMLCNMNVTIF